MDKEVEKISFKELLEKSTNLLTILGIFNALAAYSSQLQDNIKGWILSILFNVICAIIFHVLFSYYNTVRLSNKFKDPYIIFIFCLITSQYIFIDYCIDNMENKFNKETGVEFNAITEMYRVLAYGYYLYNGLCFLINIFLPKKFVLNFLKLIRFLIYGYIVFKFIEHSEEIIHFFIFDFVRATSMPKKIVY